MNPLESLEDRIMIHIWRDFYVHPSFLFPFYKAVQHDLAPLCCMFPGARFIWVREVTRGSPYEPFL